MTASWIIVGSRPRSQEEEVELANELNIRQQGVDSRRFATLSLGEPVVLPTDGPPSLLTVSDNGEVFVLDAGGRRIKKYGVNGELEYTYPPAVGGDRITGPVTHLAPSPDGSLLVARPAARQVTVIAPSGAFAVSHDVRPAIMKFAVCDRDSVLAMPEPLVGHWFQVHGLKALVKRTGILGDLISWEDGVYGTSKSVLAGGA